MRLLGILVLSLMLTPTQPKAEWEIYTYKTVCHNADHERRVTYAHHCTQDVCRWWCAHYNGESNQNVKLVVTRCFDNFRMRVFSRESLPKYCEEYE